jgi:hypothetical protein
MNPASRFIPKSQYDRIRAGWRACVIAPVVPPPPANTAPLLAVELPVASQAVAPVEAVEELTAPPVALPIHTPESALPPAIRSLDLTMMWIGAAMVVPWFGWRILDDYLARRRTASIVMLHFARRFVEEFERPLVRYDPAERPVRSRLRCRTGRRRLDILLAPGDGRGYPNLSDHKKNVEYDVSRVTRALGDDSFVSGRLYTQAGWVVVPFQFKAGPKQPGVTCISSL